MVYRRLDYLFKALSKTLSSTKSDLAQHVSVKSSNQDHESENGEWGTGRNHTTALRTHGFL